MKQTGLLIINLLGTAIFAVFSWLQHEDDNPDVYVNASLFDVWVWILFYALISVSFLLAAFRKIHWPVVIVAAIFCLVMIGVSTPGIIANFTSGDFNMTKTGMDPKTPRVEESREFFGALIALAGVGFLAWQKRFWLRQRLTLLAEE